MLSEARKYKVFVTMAEQSTQQQDEDKMIEIILANVGTVIAFRTGSPKDEELLLPLFEPYVEKGEISNLSAYNFYCRISGIETSEPISGRTLLLKDAK
jgi:DNA helicase HerA-like ATPase